jgi:hypothetical protein
METLFREKAGGNVFHQQKNNTGMSDQKPDELMSLFIEYMLQN